VSLLVVCVVFNCGGEEGVDEGRLSESRFTGNLEQFRKKERKKGKDSGARE
jgi:hypothetical protein